VPFVRLRLPPTGEVIDADENVLLRMVCGEGDARKGE
jgi:hypothetical protein